MTEGNIILTGTQARERLNLKETTLKKYVKELEDAGYKFGRNDRNHRYYTNHNIMTLEKLIEFSSYDGMTLGKAAKLIMERSNSVIPYDGMTDEGKSSNSLMEELIQSNNEKIIEVVKQTMIESEKRIIEEVDKRFMRGIRDLQAEKKELKELKQQILEIASTRESKWYDGIRIFFSALMNRRKQ